MSGRYALRERLTLLQELRQIVKAMTNLAFAELQRTIRILPALAMARDTVLQALDEEVMNESDVHAREPMRERPKTWLVIGSERGFCGAFNARIMTEAAALHRADPAARLVVAGRRLVELLGDDAGKVVALPGSAAIDEAASTLDAWLSALGRDLLDGRELWVLHAGASGWVRERLLPRPEARQAARAAALRYLAPLVLRAALERQALRLMLEAALYGSLQQENHWRLAQMQRAKDHLDKLGRVLNRRHALLRQSDITNELETLMTSMDGQNAARAVRRRSHAVAG
jgi:F-type H+-transporting ATPase subunit gamma